MRKITTAILIILVASCKTTTYSTSGTSEIRQLYQNAIKDASYPEQEEIFYDLIAISDGNKNVIRETIKGEEYILVVSWKQNVSYYKNNPETGFYNTGDYPIWVTVVPELLEKFKLPANMDIDLRLKQLLGLPPDTVAYNYFVEFWVRPQDLFRPCPDREIDDNHCDLCFPESTDSTHINWINSYRINSYYQCDLLDQYPWTQLGYTYDWNAENKSHVGLSEFVIDAGKNVVVKKVYSTGEYLSSNR